MNYFQSRSIAKHASENSVAWHELQSALRSCQRGAGDAPDGALQFVHSFQVKHRQGTSGALTYLNLP